MELFDVALRFRASHKDADQVTGGKSNFKSIVGNYDCGQKKKK
jgi:hypothetical protein